MLGDILRGHEKSQLVLIEDSGDVPGRHLILSFVRSLALRVEKVLFLTFEKPARYLEDCLPADLQSRVQIIDCSLDPLGWLRGGSATIDGDLLKVIERNLSGGSKMTVGIVIDSLLFHLLHFAPAVACQMLHAVKMAQVEDMEFAQCVCLLHQDLHDDSALSLLEHVASSVIRLVPSRSCDFQHACNIVHQRSTGKVTKITENFNMDDSFDVTEVTEAKPSFSITKPDVQPQADPAANLTFNLSLSDREKQARSQTKLPYVKDQSGAQEGSATGGQIFYQPDDVDDFDEEDPDDDLDF